MAETYSATALLETLQRLGMTHLVGVPDNGTAALFARAQARAGIDLLSVTREGEAFAVASGLWLGGKQPVVTVQNTGLLESGDSLRGTAYRMGVPLLILVGVRGHAKMISHRREIEAARTGGHATETMKRPEIDSVALLTGPTLEAWEVPYRTYRGEADTAQLELLWARANDAGHPVALLLPFAAA